MVESFINASLTIAGLFIPQCTSLILDFHRDSAMIIHAAEVLALIFDDFVAPSLHK